jgi:hypothetical protein
VSEKSWFFMKHKMMDNIQNCDSYSTCLIITDHHKVYFYIDESCFLSQAVEGRGNYEHRINS